MQAPAVSTFGVADFPIPTIRTRYAPGAADVPGGLVRMDGHCRGFHQRPVLAAYASLTSSAAGPSSSCAIHRGLGTSRWSLSNCAWVELRTQEREYGGVVDGLDGGDRVQAD